MNRLKISGVVTSIDKETNAFVLDMEDKAVNCKFTDKENVLYTGAFVELTGYFVSEDVMCEFICDACKENNMVKATNSYIAVTELVICEQSTICKNSITITGFVRQEPKQISLGDKIIYQTRIKVPKYKTYITVNALEPFGNIRKNDLITVYGNLRPSNYIKRCVCSSCQKMPTRMRSSLSVYAELVRKEVTNESTRISGYDF